MIPTLIFYNAVLFSSTFFVWLSERGATQVQRRCCIFTAFLIVFLSIAFRYELGIDWFSYEIIFSEIKNDTDSYVTERIEPGYYFLNWIVIQFGLPFEWLTGLMACLTTFIFFQTYPARYKWIFHFLLFSICYFQMFNLMRNMLAISIGWYAIFKYWNDENAIKYSFFILIGMLFHLSVFIFLLFPIVNRYPFHRNKGMYLFLFLTILTFLYFNSWMISSFIMESFFASFLGYQRYANSWYNQSTEIESGLGIIAKILLMGYPLLFIHKLELDRRRVNFVILCLFSAIIVQVLSAAVMIFRRVEHIFCFAYLMVAVILLQNRKIPFNRIALFGMLAFWLIFFNAVIFDGSTDFRETCRGRRVTPYVSVFNKEDSQRDAHVTRFARYCDAYYGIKQ